MVLEVKVLPENGLGIQTYLRQVQVILEPSWHPPWAPVFPLEPQRR